MPGIEEILDEPIPEEVEETDEEPQQPVKRRVMGRIPKQHIRNLQPQYMPSPTHSEPEYQPQPVFYPHQQPHFDQVEKMPTRSDLQRQADQQVAYEIMLEQKRMQAMYQMQNPRPTTSQKFLNVANRAAGTSRGEAASICQRTNASLTKCRPDSVSIYAKRRTDNDLNNVIRSISPKNISSKIIPDFGKSKSKKSNKKSGYAF